jgi:hypothetical protein
MPQRDPRIQKLIETVGPLKCELELPSSWADYFDRRGPMPTTFQEKRRFPRSYLRTSAALQHRQSLLALPRAETWYKVYAKDVSRGGVGFLHGEQLFPLEQMNLVLPDGRSRPIEVVRCRRIQERCFEIGAVFIAGFREAGAERPADGL